MDNCLLKMLLFMILLQIISTVINVLLSGPNVQVAIAILSMILLFGYSGILNTLFLRRKFLFGRIIYMVVAMGSELTILFLSVLAWIDVLTYFNAIAIIHVLVGFITIINFACAVMVVDEQHQDILEQDELRLLERLNKKYAVINVVKNNLDDPVIFYYDFMKRDSKDSKLPPQIKLNDIPSINDQIQMPTN